MSLNLVLRHTNLHLAFKDTTRTVKGTAVFFVVCYFEEQKQINVGSVKRVV